MSPPTLQTVKLGPQWPTIDPFLFCAHHLDRYPAGNAASGPAAPLHGREIGADFAGIDGWRMYHGTNVPGFPQHPFRCGAPQSVEKPLPARGGHGYEAGPDLLRDGQDRFDHGPAPEHGLGAQGAVRPRGKPHGRVADVQKMQPGQGRDGGEGSLDPVERL